MIPGCDSLLLGQFNNIAETIQMLFPLLDIWAPPYEEGIDCLRFAYTEYHTWAYVAPASMVVVRSMVLGLDLLFYLNLRHLRRSYPGAYAPISLHLQSPPPGMIMLITPQLVGRLSAGTAKQAGMGEVIT